LTSLSVIKDHDPTWSDWPTFLLLSIYTNLGYLHWHVCVVQGIKIWSIYWHIRAVISREVYNAWYIHFPLDIFRSVIEPKLRSINHNNIEYGDSAYYIRLPPWNKAVSVAQNWEGLFVRSLHLVHSRLGHFWGELTIGEFVHVSWRRLMSYREQ